MKWSGAARDPRRDAICLERCARRYALGSLACILVLLTAGCGGSIRAADPAPFVGRWERVEAGIPNPAFTLDIEQRGDAVRLVFANHTNGMSQTVAGSAQDGGIACTLPNADGEPPVSPAPGVPAESDLMLSLVDSGQLVVDLVLSDGTLEPVWIYQRADGASPSASGTL